MYTYAWYHWITFFYIYCFFGWVFESAYVSIKKRKLVNRGFLRLPMLPLYGTGAVMMLWVSLPVQDNLILVYIAGFLAATALEYVTGWAMERLFKMRYWDYSSQPFNINGYVCLGSSIAWGFLTILLTEFLHKPVERLVLGLDPAVEFSFLAVVSVLFIADTIQSVRAALDLGHALEAMTKMRADLEELQVQMALLKAEAAGRAAELRDEYLDRAAELRDEYLDKASSLREEYLEKAASLREEATGLAANSLGGAFDKASSLRGEALERAAALKEEAADRAAAIREGALDRAASIREEASSRVSSLFSDSNRASDLASLSSQLDALRKKRLDLSRHMTFYRRGLLKGNPTARSKKFGDALKELMKNLDQKD